MSEFIYTIVDYIIFSLYLFFIFLSVQIWFVWKDIDRNDLNFKVLFTDSFFKKNCIYVYSFSVYFIIHGFFDKTTTSIEYLELLGILTLTSLVLFTYDWYSTLRSCASKKSLPQELLDFRCMLKEN